MIEILVMHVGHFWGTNYKDQEFLLNYCIRCVLASDCKNIVLSKYCMNENKQVNLQILEMA